MKGKISNDIGTIFQAAASELPPFNTEQTESWADKGEGCVVAAFSLVGEFFVKRPLGKFKKKGFLLAIMTCNPPFQEE